MRIFLKPVNLLCFDHTRIKKPTRKIKDKMYSLIMLSLAKSETPDSSGYFQMSLANWGNPSQWPFERHKVRCFITGIVLKKMTVRGERRIMSRAFSITATKERGVENYCEEKHVIF